MHPHVYGSPPLGEVISTARGLCDSVREPMVHCTKASEVSSPLAGFLLG